MHPTLTKRLDHHSHQLTDVMRAVGGARTIADLKRAVREAEPSMKDAEHFARSIDHVEVPAATQFRQTVGRVRALLDERTRALGGVSASIAVRVNPHEQPSVPAPPANVVVLSRADARDVRAYERAKTQAKAEGKELLIEPV